MEAVLDEHFGRTDTLAPSRWKQRRGTEHRSKRSDPVPRRYTGERCWILAGQYRKDPTSQRFTTQWVRAHLKIEGSAHLRAHRRRLTVDLLRCPSQKPHFNGAPTVPVRCTTSEASSASWLSNVRNAVQYRHTHGVWFPFQLLKSDRRILSRLAGRWDGDPLAIPLTTGSCGDLGAFVAGCTFVVAFFCRSLIARIAERGKRGRAESFVHYGPQRYLNTLSRTI